MTMEQVMKQLGKLNEQQMIAQKQKVEDNRTKEQKLDALVTKYQH